MKLFVTASIAVKRNHILRTVKIWNASLEVMKGRNLYRGNLPAADQANPLVMLKTRPLSGLIWIRRPIRI
jgi:hypothetical protein